MNKIFYIAITNDVIFDSIVKHLSYIECLSLVRAVPRLKSRCPSFVKLLKYYLAEARIPSDFYQQIDDNNIISGSFLLYLLLSTPITVLSTTSVAPKWKYGDIDVFVFGNYNVDGYLQVNATEVGCGSVAGYGNGTVLNSKWKLGDVLINNICLSKDVTVSKLLAGFDLDIVKNYYNGKTLVINYPISVLKQKCTFVVKDLARIHSMCTTISERITRYTLRSFEIDIQLSCDRSQLVAKIIELCDDPKSLLTLVYNQAKDGDNLNNHHDMDSLIFIKNKLN